ncbi:MAG: glycosyltransferase family A protein, partial [Chloroflexota bacterium]
LIMPKVSVCIPTYNTANYLPYAIDSVLNQDYQDYELVICDDASTDNTAEIVARYQETTPWITLINKEKRENKGDRQRGKGVVDTFYFGRDRLSHTDYDFIIKLDGDVSFKPTYFETMLKKFADNPKLGITGGGLYERTNGENWSLISAPDHVGGPNKMYRRTCFDAIGGIVSALGWDGLDEWQALAQSWEVESFEEEPIYHYRIMGNATGLMKARVEQGYGAHYMGYHPLYTLFRSAKHFLIRPYVIGGIAMAYGYFQAISQNREQLPDPDLKQFIQKTQWDQLKGALRGTRVYKNGSSDSLVR